MNAPQPNEPASYPRRVLLAATGLSPQVVTETVYALAVQAQCAFVPTEIHLVTTKQGKEHARLNLLSGDPGWFQRLRADYALPEIAFDAGRIHVLTGPDGAPLADIRTPEENEHAADTITRLVAEFTADTSAALHVSLAGGRKTMGYYLGYALSLFGRPQDRLSHVLVSAPFESHPRFFYPTPGECVIHTLESRPLDCRDAVVTLAQIPFVRLRDELPPRLLGGNARLTEIVTAANRALQPPRLTLDTMQRLASADDQPLSLGRTEFAVLLWLAERARAGAPEVDWTRPEAADEFLGVARRIFNPMAAEYERIEKAVDWRRSAAIKLGKYFEPHKSRINDAIERALGTVAARRYAIPPRAPNALPLAPEQIEIHP